MYTTSQAASIIGCATRSVCRWCDALGYHRLGRDYILSEEQLADVKSHVQSRRGRPTGARNKPKPETSMVSER